MSCCELIRACGAWCSCLSPSFFFESWGMLTRFLLRTKKCLFIIFQTRLHHLIKRGIMLVVWGSGSSDLAAAAMTHWLVGGFLKFRTRPGVTHDRFFRWLYVPVPVPVFFCMDHANSNWTIGSSLSEEVMFLIILSRTVLSWLLIRRNIECRVRKSVVPTCYLNLYFVFNYFFELRGELYWLDSSVFTIKH